MLCSRERGPLFRTHFARLSKVVVFCCTLECTSKENAEREPSLAILERGGHFLGLALIASQKLWFFVALLNALVRGMQRGKLLSLLFSLFR